MRLSFSNLLGTLICGKICIYLLRIHNKKDQKKYLFDDDYVIFFLLIFFIKAYVVGTHLNCIDNICLYKDVDKKYTGCNLKTTELLDCALIGICAVIRSNTVYTH